jgi:septal ring factor EnvC (AmiA/AmiB activator)
MFPKCASGTSGELRENKGCDMTEMNEGQLRQKFFCCLVSENNGDAIAWAQKRMLNLEEHAFDMVQLLEQQDEKLADLQSHLQERNATIDKLEAEIKRLTGLTDQLSSSCANLQSDEERHQRRRREKMLDGITEICVRNGIDQLETNTTAERDWGRMSRYAADNICDGIDEYDAKQ